MQIQDEEHIIVLPHGLGVDSTLRLLLPSTYFGQQKGGNTTHRFFGCVESGLDDITNIVVMKACCALQAWNRHLNCLRL
jgi:hypothetical protein